MTLVQWIAALAGAAIVGLALRDVFHTILHPAGSGHLEPAIMRTVWRLCKRLGPRTLKLAGPAGMVSAIATWAMLLVVGWALIYWPHMPGEFRFSSGLAPSSQGSFWDALYFSIVALATLGLGDLSAQETPLRLASGLEALIGFGLLSASISWVLSVYPALSRRRALAGRLSLLLAGGADEGRFSPHDDPTTMATTLHSIADALVASRVDLIQSPAIYFFHSPYEDLALPAVLPRLEAALSRDDLPAEATAAAATVREAIGRLVDTLGDGPFGVDAEGRDARLAAYARDHRVGLGSRSARESSSSPTRC